MHLLKPTLVAERINLGAFPYPSQARQDACGKHSFVNFEATISCKSLQQPPEELLYTRTANLQAKSIFPDMCYYKWVEIICPCDKGKNCCMNHKPKVLMNGRFRHSTGRQVPVRETGQRCQFRRRNAKGGWADPKCKYSDNKDVVGSRLSETECLWCSMDCVCAPVDDPAVPDTSE